MVKLLYRFVICFASFFAASFIEIIRKFGEIEMALSCFDCQKTIELVNELPEHHKSSPLALFALGKAYFELADYPKVCKFLEFCFSRLTNFFGAFRRFNFSKNAIKNTIIS